MPLKYLEWWTPLDPAMPDATGTQASPPATPWLPRPQMTLIRQHRRWTIASRAWQAGRLRSSRIRHPDERRARNQKLGTRNFNSVILDNRIRQNVLRDLLCRSLSFGLAHRTVESDLEVLTLPHISDLFEAHQLDRMMNRLPLRIKDARLQGYVYFCFHISTRKKL